MRMGDRPAVVHDFFIQDGGAERCAIEFASLVPSATIETTFFDAARFGGSIDPARVRTWPLQRLFGPTPQFRALLPLYPVWFSTRDLRRHPLVISSSIAFAKAVRTAPSALHIAYVYTPMRYAWDLDEYLEGSSLGPAARFGARVIRPVLRRWDVATSRRPDVIVAISATVQRRIAAVWGRESRIIFPPVDVAAIPPSDRDDGFLLVAARMLAYRRLDLAVMAATSLERELVVVGDGPERARLRSIAGPTVRFLGRVDRSTLLDLFARCHAYVVPGVEDFGIAPVEAMAAGKPVVAFRGGGVTETVVEGKTGVFFDRPEPSSLAAAIEDVERLAVDRAAIHAHADAFDTRVFRSRWRSLFEELGVDPTIYSAE